ncbi:MAG TPA: hypothetical protein ENN67_02460, partial [Firmicutes bacterium]|nr:hypothetical protein [Bacillota bacterium]
MKFRKALNGSNHGLKFQTLAIVTPFVVAVLLTTTSWSGSMPGSGRAEAANPGTRLILLGFDGMDFDLVSRYLDEGKLPNLARLRDRGIYSPLYSTMPPESPVAWSAFVTGTNPGKTGIFDFLRRNPDTYFPELNMTDIMEPATFVFDTIPTKPAVMRNARRGESFWSYASKENVATYGIMMPMNMPPDEAPGSWVTSGLGVPDARRTMGTYIYFVDDIDAAKERTGSDYDTEMGGRVIEVEKNGNEIVSFIPGPLDPLHPGSLDELRAPVFMTVNQSAKTVDFTIHNKTPFRFIIFFVGLIVALIVALILWPLFGRMKKSASRGFTVSLVIFIIALGILYGIARPTSSMETFTISEGKWSGWIPIKYLITDWVGMEGFFKLYLIETEPSFQLYVTPVNIDPRGTMVALSFPGDYMRKLLNKYGYFKTYGWDSETWAMNENVIDEETFMEDLLDNLDTKSNMVLDQMKQNEWRLFAAIYQATDHVSHMFWRTLDPDHPMYSEEIAEKYGDAILTVYQRADTLVGKVMDEVMDDDDELIVMSDHGFNSFRYSVNLNRWLTDNGYMTEKPNLLANLMGGELRGVPELFKRQQQFFEWVDWSKTKAYALGLGQIYINLEGREAKGIVSQNERDALIDEIIEGLKELRDPATGLPVLVGAYRGDAIYHGDNMEYAPDIVV